MKVNAKFEELKGKTLSKVDVLCVDTIVFTTTEGEVYELYHHQDCCENVTIDDICGDIQDLIGEPLLVAEEVVHEQDTTPDGVEPYDGYGIDSFTWTFYKLDTRKGGVTIRWFGESNGYYSESVDFAKVIENV